MYLYLVAELNPPRDWGDSTIFHCYIDGVKARKKLKELQKEDNYRYQYTVVKRVRVE